MVYLCLCAFHNIAYGRNYFLYYVTFVWPKSSNFRVIEEKGWLICDTLYIELTLGLDQWIKGCDIERGREREITNCNYKLVQIMKNAIMWLLVCSMRVTSELRPVSEEFYNCNKTRSEET